MLPEEIVHVLIGYWLSVMWTVMLLAMTIELVHVSGWFVWILSVTDYVVVVMHCKCTTQYFTQL